MNKSVALSDIYPLIEEQLLSGGSASFVIHGTSMLPLLRDRLDSVRVIKADKIKRRDIILYRRASGEFILHRVVRVKGNTLYCRGDNQFDNEIIDKSQLLCVVSHYEKDGIRYSVKSARHTIYSIFWLNSVLIRRAYAKLFKGRRK